MPDSIVVIRGGTVVDATGSRRADVLIRDDRIVAVESAVDPPGGATVLDAGGCIVAPGLVDLHAHLRQPGAEQAETVESGSRAAALGGYTAVVAMPNTNPAIDSAAVVREVQELAVTALCDVRVAGAITVGRKGEALSPLGEMADLGVKLFTDDGTGVQDSRLMRRALEYASALGVTLAQHCEDLSLAAGGQMNEGAWSSRLGLPGAPAQAEEVMLARDLALLRVTAGMGARMHFQHLSTEGSMDMVRAARAEGLPVTAEAAPHHFTLTDERVQSYDPVFKVNPPLRSARDVEAVKVALRAGTLDAIATDHAPHPQEDKERPFDQAAPGMVGLETALALAITELDLPIEQVLALMSWQPARIAGLEATQGNSFIEGSSANVCIFNAHETWLVDAATLASRSKNTPYDGMKLTGRVRHTVYEGEIVVKDAEAQR
ncbi:MAG TPA: dihydroorotase [Acidimicrobiales bacterium]|nr:dihydroorotase [Acidimicrobiales bacterium]